RASALAATGATGSPPPVAGGLASAPPRWGALRGPPAHAGAAHPHPNPPADPVHAAGPARLQLRDGYLRLASDEQRGPAPRKTPEPRQSLQPREPAPPLPPRIVAGVKAVRADLAGAPFMAPEAGRLRDLGLDARAIAAAARVGLLLRVTEQIVLAPGAQAEAARVLARLPQPFTTAEARQALGTTRRVAIPLLEYLDRAGITQRLPDDRRRLRLIPASRAARPAHQGSI